MPAIDYRELTRFIVAGALATLGNLMAVWAARQIASFTVALLFGIAAGMSISFLMTKFFAFRSREWARTGGEMGRFLIVYCAGLVLYWFTALGVRTAMIENGWNVPTAEGAGVIAGAAIMTVTGYFGHRFFTYRAKHSPEHAYDR